MAPNPARVNITHFYIFTLLHFYTFTFLLPIRFRSLAHSINAQRKRSVEIFVF